jgi:PAS domain S-box-containing protein
MRAVFLTTFRQYRVPLLATVVATVLSLLLWGLGPRVPFGLFVAAVLISAWRHGLRSALLATGLSTVALALLTRWHATQDALDSDYWLRLVLFALVGLLAGYLSQQCQQAIRAVSHVHDLLSGSGLGLIAADAEGRVTALNPLACSLTGMSETEAVGLPLERVFRLVQGPGRQPVSLPLGEILTLARGHELPEGTRLVAVNDRETEVEGAAGAVRDSEGRSEGILVLFRDAGPRVQATHELWHRAERFRALAGHAPTPLLVLDAEGRCIYSNPAGQAACDCSAEECLGDGWARHVMPEDRSGLLSDWSTAVQEKQPFSAEFRLQTARGGPRWFRVRSAPMLSDEGGILGQVATLEEVTDRKHAERELRSHRRLVEAVLATVTDASTIKDATARCLHANEAARHLPPTLVAPLAEASVTALETGQVHRMEITAPSGDEQRTYLATTAVCRDEYDLVIGVVEIVREVTEERRRADDLRAAQEAARQADDAHGKTREDLTRQLQQQSEARRQAEEAVQQVRQEYEKALDEALGAQQRAEDELRRERAAAQTGAEELLAAQNTIAELRPWQQEVEGLRKTHAEAETGLHDELARVGESLRELRAVHERLRAYLDSLPGLVCCRDGEGRFIFVNRALARLFGREGEDLDGRVVGEVVPPEIATLLAGSDNAVRAGEIVEIDEQLPAGDGPRRHRAWRFPVRDVWGAVQAVGSFAIDADRLTQADDARREEVAALQHQLAQKEDVEKACREEVTALQLALTERRQAEENLQRQLAARQHEAAEKQRVEEELRREVDAIHQELHGARQAVEEWRGQAAGLRDELAQRRSEGEEGHRHVSRLQEEIAQCKHAAEDLQRQVHFLERIIDGTPDGLLAHDQDGTCRIWNTALEQLLGRPRALAVGRMVAELFPIPESGETNDDVAGRLRAWSSTAWAGQSDVLETKHNPVRAATGEVIGGMAVLRTVAAPESQPAATTIIRHDGPAEYDGLRQGPHERRGGLVADVDWLAFN